MPKELVAVGADLNFSKGRICFSFNLNGCTAAANGQKCPKGWHVCCHPKCGFSPDHGLKDCPHKA